ncbi:histidinol-phosphate transaminase [Methanorbis rubei]|uniref:Threonine-phosphate decarboxylase n=1 Tax=Methanorbis rubei TaxID=3028300 RepID=A0AAE4SE41_9EURY|nr:Threonine-phosphate decarboxylase [Methanocorpusculaceae archaeon Cs1]
MERHFPKKAVHGGKAQELRRTFGCDFLDVSASMNPHVPAFPVDYSCADLSFYPDDSYIELKESISRVFERNVDEICVGNGSAELIRVYCHTTLKTGDIARIDQPTFSEYGLSAELAGAEIRSGDQLGNQKPKVRFICNPNNPTGTLLSREQMLAELELCTSDGTKLFVDEAFMDLSEPEDSITDLRSPDLFVMRSLTKSFCVPGIRFGFGFGDPDLIAKIETARTPWTVNAFAEYYAKLALAHYHELRDSARKLAEERDWYYARLRDLELSYEESTVNYILIHLDRDAAHFTRAMIDKGILVRDCTSFGLARSIRVSVETREKNVRVLEAVEACLR